MAQSLSSIYVHLTFSTSGRRLYLDEHVRNIVFPYIVGIMKHKHAPVLEIGGADEHLHILFRLPKDIALMHLIRIVKQESSKHIKQVMPGSRLFAWQTGYCALSVSPSGVESVRRYIRNQERHHRTRSYRDEVLRMLRDSGTDYDERYLWD